MAQIGLPIDYLNAKDWAAFIPKKGDLLYATQQIS